MALESLAPDQRAVVQLVLQQDRSYGDLAGMLGIPEDSVRRRARAGLAALGADRPLGAADQSVVADWLLGQQDGRAREATEALVARSAPAREWAAVVAEELRPVARHGLPEIPRNGAGPAGKGSAPAEPVTVVAPARPRRTRRKGAATNSSAGRSSKLGGAALIALAAILLATVVGWIVNRDTGGTERATDPAVTPRATSTPQQQPLAQLPLSSAGGSRAEGLVQVNTATDGLVGFTLVARNVPANTSGDAYAVWLTDGRRPALRLGFAQRVGKDGTLATSGPEAKTDPAAFTRGLTTYEQMVVSRETSDTVTKPTEIVLRASLATLRSGGGGSAGG